MWKQIKEIVKSNLSKRTKLVSVANCFLGQNEIRGNKGFVDKSFEKKMQESGWNRGWAWCACFVEMVYDVALPELDEKLEKLFHPGCTRTLKNFKDAGYDVSEVPEVGSVMIMQRDGSWKGHAGIVHHVEGDIVFTIEGNTNDQGGREGYTVDLKKRNYKDKSRSMDVVGFIKVIQND